MPSYLQQIASRFEDLEPDKARELLRIDAAYIRFGLSDGVPGDPRDGAANRLLRHLPRMARMRHFRLYRIGIGERADGFYTHQAVALLDVHQLPTPGNTLAVLDPTGSVATHATAREHDFHQYSFEAWQDLQRHYGRGCALLTHHPTPHQPPLEPPFPNPPPAPVSRLCR
ncbi:MAG: hypothetical protein KDJ54_09720 [Candidatus Competibacteraceae bacterium]|nr:hypothetical protein [Candidatus Competibacteraceae bacterium]